MANKIDKQIEKAIDEVLKDYRKNMISAVEYAYDRAAFDIKQHAKSVLARYYREWQPEEYDRTYYLWHAIMPYKTPLKFTGNAKSTKITGSVGVEYDPYQLEQHYTTNSKKRKEAGYNVSWENGGQVEEEWILDNYLNGLHPDGGSAGKGYQMPDRLTPTARMTYFLKTYYDTFDTNVLMHLLSEVGKKI